MARRKGEGGRVFKGRTRQLTKAIFWTLALKGPSTAYDICREVRTQKALKYTRYSVVNRRVRTLEELSYVEKVGTKNTKAGFKAPLYQLTVRAYLAIVLNQINLEHFIEGAEENAVLSALATLSSAL